MVDYIVQDRNTGKKVFLRIYENADKTCTLSLFNSDLKKCNASFTYTDGKKVTLTLNPQTFEMEKIEDNGTILAEDFTYLIDKYTAENLTVNGGKLTWQENKK